jgi:hypothetical protein
MSAALDVATMPTHRVKILASRTHLLAIECLSDSPIHKQKVGYILFAMEGKTLTARILQRFRRSKPGAVFTPKDFLDLGGRSSIGWVLYELVRQGKIRRVARGLYDYPRTSKSLGVTNSPDVDRAARAYARKQQWDVVPHPAVAANLLGLSQHVPARIVYLSSGPTQTIRIGNRDVVFKNARPKAFAAKSEIGAIVIQALRHLGKDRIDAEVKRRLGRQLNQGDLRKVLRDTRYAAAWVHAVVQEIAEERAWSE